MVDIFCDLDAAQLEQIYRICKRKTIQKDGIIFEENSPSKEMYIILKGKWRSWSSAMPSRRMGKPPPAHHQAWAGQCFGEIALGPGLRSAPPAARAKPAACWCWTAINS
jgi:signal-transduction protein with cAMP-binding, CBS, and nucleotidyltransferase domain